jgi:hypothetical protein
LIDYADLLNVGEGAVFAKKNTIPFYMGEISQEVGGKSY